MTAARADRAAIEEIAETEADRGDRPSPAAPREDANVGAI